MASFREQMQRLADSITKSRNERRAFLDKNQKECTRKRRERKDQRLKTSSELAKEAKSLTKQLTEFRRHNQKAVERTLRDLRTRRLKTARNAKALLRQEVIKNKREIARLLRQNKCDRTRAARQQYRASATTLQYVRSQVQRIRIETNRMTKSWARDRNDARQIWQRLQSASAVRRESNSGSRAMAAPALLVASPGPVPVSEPVSQRARVLPLPPNLATQGVSSAMNV
ncbi:MAG: hypothetical protein ACK56W_18165 [Pirellula sp.]|jgi:hypothetical protein|nr:hypothetical protein [Pirellula sp.]